MCKTLVHKNLHNGLWAITQGGRVVGYADLIVLEHVDVKWDAKKALFSQSGNKRTVHCWARGESIVHVEGFQAFKGRELVMGSDHNDWTTWKEYDHRRVSYNPHRDTTMMMEGCEYVSSPYAVFTETVVSDNQSVSTMYAIVG